MARPAAASEDDSAAFNAPPTLDIPQQVYKVLRSIRVVLNEVITANRITNGYLSVADLTREMVTNHGSDLNIEQVSEMVTSLGAQFFDASPTMEPGQSKTNRLVPFHVCFLFNLIFSCSPNVRLLLHSVRHKLTVVPTA